MLRVNGERLLAALADLARFGATDAGGVSRPAYTEADVAARAHVRALMRAAGLVPAVDAAGNTIARRAGRAVAGAPLVIGSHTDSVPDGGRYDGALGVLAAIEVARTLLEHGVALAHPLEVVDFQNEEGGLVGSRAMAGRLTPSDLALPAASGIAIGDGIRRLGGDPALLARAARAPGSIAAYLELHIEQGRVLERAPAEIGVVAGIVGIRYWEVTVDGVAGHAGTTPMADRHDALLTAARFIDMVDRTATELAGAHVATVGRLAAHPGAPNVVPGRATLTLELRDLEAAVMDVLFARIAAGAERLGERNGTRLAFRATHAIPPAPTDGGVRAAIADAASELGLRTVMLPSGAGHDAQSMAALGPTGMLFVPSVNGISHSPLERTDDRDVVNGANVLLGAVTRLDAAG